MRVQGAARVDRALQAMVWPEVKQMARQRLQQKLLDLCRTLYSQEVKHMAMKHVEVKYVETPMTHQEKLEEELLDVGKGPT